MGKKILTKTIVHSLTYRPVLRPSGKTFDYNDVRKIFEKMRETSLYLLELEDIGSLAFDIIKAVFLAL